MNQSRRNQLAAIDSELGRIASILDAGEFELADLAGYAEDLSSALEDLEEIQNDEQEYLDNMPESFQNGEKGGRVEEALGWMDEAAQKIEEAAQELRDFKAGQDVFDAVTTLEEASNAIVEAQA